MKTFLTLFVLFFSTSISFNSYGLTIDDRCMEHRKDKFEFCKERKRDKFVCVETYNKIRVCKTFWFENGQIKLEKKYKDGKIDGKWTWWYENGQIKLEANYKDGTLDGKWTWWFENGQIEKEGNY